MVSQGAQRVRKERRGFFEITNCDSKKEIRRGIQKYPLRLSVFFAILISHSKAQYHN
jgi:hypothetical protein